MKLLKNNSQKPYTCSNQLSRNRGGSTLSVILGATSIKNESWGNQFSGYFIILTKSILADSLLFKSWFHIIYQKREEIHTVRTIWQMSQIRLGSVPWHLSVSVVCNHLYTATLYSNPL